MHVLVQSQYRLVRSESGQLLQDGLERVLLLLLRAQFERAITIACCDRQQRGKEGGGFGNIWCRLGEECLQLVEFLRWAIVPLEAGRPFEQVNHGMERTSLMERRTEV